MAKKIKTDESIEKKLFHLTRIKKGFRIGVTKVTNGFGNHSKPTNEEIESIMPAMEKNLDMKENETLVIFYEGIKI